MGFPVLVRCHLYIESGHWLRYPDGPVVGYPMCPLWPDYVILTDLKLGIPCAHCDQTTLSWRTWGWVSHVPIVTRLRYPDGPEAGYPMYPLCVTRLRYPDGPEAGYPICPLWPDYVILTDLRLGIPCAHCDQTTLSWRTWGWVSHVPIVTRLRYPDGPEAGYPMCPLWPDYVIPTDLRLGIPCTHCDRLRYPDGPEAGYPMCPLWPDYVILTDLRLGIPCAHCDQTTLSWRTWGWVSHVPIVTRLRYPDGPEAGYPMYPLCVTRLRYPDGPEAGYPMCPLWPDYVILTDLRLGIPCAHCDQTTLSWRTWGWVSHVPIVCDQTTLSWRTWGWVSHVPIVYDQTTLSWRTWGWVSHVPIVTRLRYPDGPEAGYPMCPLWPDYVILTDLRLGIPYAQCDQTTLSWRTWGWVSHVPIVCDQTTLSWRTWGWVSHVPIVTRLRYPDGPEAGYPMYPLFVTRLRYPDGPEAGYPMCPLWPDYVILTDLRLGIPCAHCDQTTLSWRTWGWVSHVPIVTRLRYPEGHEAWYTMYPLWQTTLSWRTWGWVSHVPIVTRLRYPDGPEAGYPMCPLWPDYVILTDLRLGIPCTHCLWPDYVILTDLRLGIPCAHCDQTTLSWRTWGWVSHVPIVTRLRYPDGPEAGYPMCPLWPDYVILTDLRLGIPCTHCVWPDYVILTDLRLGIPCAHCDQITLSWRTWGWVSHVPIVTRLRYPDGPEAGYTMYPLWQTTLSWRTWGWVSHVPIVTRLRYPDGPEAGYPMCPLWPDYVILTDLRLGIPCAHCDQTTLSWRTWSWVSHVPIVTRLRYPDGPVAGYPISSLWPDYVTLTP